MQNLSVLSRIFFVICPVNPVQTWQQGPRSVVVGLGQSSVTYVVEL